MTEIIDTSAIRCRHCHEKIHAEAKVCKHCQQYQSYWVQLFKHFLPTIISVIAMFVAIYQAVQVSSDRNETQEIQKQVEDLAVRAARQNAGSAIYSGWGLHGTSDFKERDKYFEESLNDSLAIIELTGQDPDKFSEIRLLKGMVEYIRDGHEGQINMPMNRQLLQYYEKYNKDSNNRQRLINEQ